MIDLCEEALSTFIISHLSESLWLIGGITFAAVLIAGMVGLDDAFERARREDPD